MIFLIGAGRLGRLILQRIDAVPLVRTPKGLKNERIIKFTEKALKKHLRDADTIIHLAGSMDFSNPKRMHKANVELTKKIIDAAPKKAKIIFASSISVYGKNLLEIPATEKTPTNPDSIYAKTKLEAERIVSSHPNHLIFRIGTLYHPSYPDFFRILKLVEKERMPILGNGNNSIPFTPAEEVAGMFSIAVKKGKGTYILAGKPLTQKEILSIAAKELGAKPPSFHLPQWLALFFVFLEEKKAFLLGKKPFITQEHIKILSSHRIFNCSKAEKELGFKPIPLEKGIGKMVMEYKGETNEN